MSVHYRLEDLEAFEQRELRTLLKQVLQRDRPLPLIRAIARLLDLSVNTQGIESNPEVFKPAARQDLKPAPKVKGAAPIPTEEPAQAPPAKVTAVIDLSLQPNHAWYLVHTKGRQEDSARSSFYRR